MNFLKLFQLTVGQVVDSLNFSDDLFSKKFNREKPSSDTTIIFFCRIGVRSQKAADSAIQLGFNK